MILESKEVTDYLVRSSDLPQRGFGDGIQASMFNGIDYGLSGTSMMFGEVAPGSRVQLHQHPYDELFMVREGQGAYTIGDVTVEAVAGDLVLIPAGVPHTFVNTGSEVLCHAAVHAAPRITIEWVEPPQS